MLMRLLLVACSCCLLLTSSVTGHFHGHESLAFLDQLPPNVDVKTGLLMTRASVEDVGTRLLALEASHGTTIDDVTPLQETLRRAYTLHEQPCDRVQKQYDDKAAEAHELREKLKLHERLSQEPGRGASKFQQLVQKYATSLQRTEEAFQVLVTAKLGCDRMATLLQQYEMRIESIRSALSNDEL